MTSLPASSPSAASAAPLAASGISPFAVGLWTPVLPMSRGNCGGFTMAGRGMLSRFVVPKETDQ